LIYFITIDYFHFLATFDDYFIFFFHFHCTFSLLSFSFISLIIFITIFSYYDAGLMPDFLSLLRHFIDYIITFISLLSFIDYYHIISFITLLILLIHIIIFYYISILSAVDAIIDGFHYYHYHYDFISLRFSFGFFFHVFRLLILLIIAVAIITLSGFSLHTVIMRAAITMFSWLFIDYHDYISPCRLFFIIIFYIIIYIIINIIIYISISLFIASLSFSLYIGCLFLFSLFSHDIHIYLRHLLIHWY